MKKILIVEDEQAYSQLLSLQLSAKGYVVVTATDGREGLDKIDSEKPDLVLLDIKMPVMDGMTMLGLLRQDPMNKGLKVILLTNVEPDEKIIGKTVTDEPLYYFEKNDIKLNDLITKIKNRNNVDE